MVKLKMNKTPYGTVVCRKMVEIVKISPEMVASEILAISRCHG